MFRVLSCITQEHNLALVLLAGLICASGAWIVIRLFLRASTSSRESRIGWLFLTGVAAGSSICTTHFVAVLAFEPKIPTAFDPGLTVASLFIAVAWTGAGFAVATIRSPSWLTEAGGGIVGLGIAAMHFTGMAAYRVAGVITWDMTYVVASILIGGLFGALALNRVIRPLTSYCRYGGAVALTLAICGMHFTAMAAVVISPDPTILVPDQMMSRSQLVLTVVSMAILVIGTGFASYAIDSRTTADARSRLRQLADATIEGILVTDGTRVIDANASFEAMIGQPREAILGANAFEDLFKLNVGAPAPGGERFECNLHTWTGDSIPVEVIAREMTGGGYRLVYAVRDLRERHASESRIRFLADHDALTGLPNRASFEAFLDSALENATREDIAVAVLNFDLKRFKDINDIHGHVAGDRLMRDLAVRLNASLGDGEFLARLGGDEFAAIQVGVPQPESARECGMRLIDALAQPFGVGASTIRIETGIGIACYPGDGAGREQLMANAQMAMRRAKMSADMPVCFFEQRMDAAVRYRRDLAHDLAEAIRNQELEIHYQVQNAVATGEVTGFEVLVRWTHPAHGPVRPDEFIPIAEESNLIGEIGGWVLREACREAASWDRPYKIAVNLSPRQFHREDLPEVVHAVLLETGLPASRLELEITETTIVEDIDQALHILRRLKALGVSIAMDDFGTGYSSLSTLHAFPFDKIKIDKSFVRNLASSSQSAVIVRTILSLGGNLSIPVLAEGVESQEDVDFLKAEGCDEAQGFFYGRPVTGDQIRHLVMNENVLPIGLKRRAG